MVYIDSRPWIDDYAFGMGTILKVKLYTPSNMIFEQSWPFSHIPLDSGRTKTAGIKRFPDVVQFALELPKWRDFHCLLREANAIQEIKV